MAERLGSFFKSSSISGDDLVGVCEGDDSEIINTANVAWRFLAE